MKILRNTRRVLSLMGYLPDERIFSFKYGHVISSLLFILTLILLGVSSIIYAMRRLNAGDHPNFLFASNQVVAVIPAIVSFCTIMYHKEKIRDVIASFQKITDQCNATE